MLISIHQPDFIPWLGLFNKIQQSDLFVIGDTVQFRKRGWTNRNQIKTANGPIWITVPVHQHLGQPINDVKIRTQQQGGKNWFDNHLRTLQISYSKSKFYDKYIGIYEKIFKKSHEYLFSLNIDLIKATMEILGIDVPIKLLSDLNITSKKTQLAIDICDAVGADSYLSGTGGRNYLDENLLKTSGIKMFYNDFVHPEHKQLFMKLGFFPNMSILDILFNCGEKTPDILKSSVAKL